MAEAKEEETYSNDDSFSMRFVIKSLQKKWPKVRNMSTSDLHSRMEAVTKNTASHHADTESLMILVIVKIS